MKNTPKNVGLPGLRLPCIKSLGLKQPCLKSGLNTTMAEFNPHNFIFQKTGKDEREMKPLSAGRGGKYYSRTSAMGSMAMYGVQ